MKNSWISDARKGGTIGVSSGAATMKIVVKTEGLLF